MQCAALSTDFSSDTTSHLMTAEGLQEATTCQMNDPDYFQRHALLFAPTSFLSCNVVTDCLNTQLRVVKIVIHSLSTLAAEYVVDSWRHDKVRLTAVIFRAIRFAGQRLETRIVRFARVTENKWWLLAVFLRRFVINQIEKRTPTSQPASQSLTKE
jgi:hypothetical protein